MRMGAGGTPDWSRLYSQGRCKYMGVAWSDEEQKELSLAEDRQGLINKLREGYIDAHKAEIIDPMASVRQNKIERDAVAEEYEIVFGKKPHHFATIATMRKKLSEKETNKTLEEPNAKKMVKK